MKKNLLILFIIFLSIFTSTSISMYQADAASINIHPEPWGAPINSGYNDWINSPATNIPYDPHCPAGSYYNGSTCKHIPSSPSVSSCPSNSTNYGNGCACNAGYKKTSAGCERYTCPDSFEVAPTGECYCIGPNILYEGKCLKYSDFCRNKYGENSHHTDPSGKACSCNTGYEFNGDKTACIKSIICPNNSKYNIISKKCDCIDGYELSGSSCIYKKISNCPLNSHPSTTDSTKCWCDSGYEINSTKTACIIKTESVMDASNNTSSDSTNEIPAEFTFTQNLKQGNIGIQVKYLQILLNSDPETSIGNKGNETEYFGASTKKAVIKFQDKYASDILAPYGISSSTGFFGAASRIKANTLLK
jgi:hypothetical protein